MIESIWLADNYDSTSFRKIDLDAASERRVDLAKGLSSSITPKFKIIFKQRISKFRNHDYTWRHFDRSYISNNYCPKIILLQNGYYVQPNFNTGIWELNPNNPFELLWYFNPKYAQPVVNYDTQNLKVVTNSNSELSVFERLSLLFSKRNAIEVSRSQIAFSAIACFTDHCDFDTVENLQIQRAFFKKYNIKVTKGFFLNHYSKREDNASWQNDSEELQKWQEDGHEMAYHSLTQSLRTDDAIREFKNFKPPFPIETWIDHGFQPYNLSTYKKSAISIEDYKSKFKSSGIKNLWNYLDSGTSTVGVINQLNTNQFTLSAFLKGLEGFSFSKKAKLFFKLLLMHHFSDSFHQQLYKDTSSNFKKIRYQRQFNKTLPLANNVISFIKIGLATIYNWNSIKDKPFDHAKFAPILFKHKLNTEEFTIFQTLEMVDFVNSMNRENIDLLIKECGLFIAHTYFSVPMEYHSGRMIVDGKINPSVDSNFKYLANQIQADEIWNPTLSQLAVFLSRFENVEFDVNENGELFCFDHLNFTIRNIE